MLFSLLPRSARLPALGNVLAAVEEYKLAIDCYTKCMTLRRELHDLDGLASTIHNLAIAYEQAQLLQKALQVQALSNQREKPRERGTKTKKEPGGRRAEEAR